MDTLILNGIVITGDADGRVIRDGGVAVQGTASPRSAPPTSCAGSSRRCRPSTPGAMLSSPA
ncbi:MAG: hypothetical protein U0531_12595 [Dehalococcoidia bacterium]